MGKKSAPAIPPPPQLPEANTSEAYPVRYKNLDTGKEGGLFDFFEDMKSPDGSKNLKDDLVGFIKRPLPKGYKRSKSRQTSLLEGDSDKTTLGKGGMSERINFLE